MTIGRNKHWKHAESFFDASAVADVDRSCDGRAVVCRVYVCVCVRMYSFAYIL